MLLTVLELLNHIQVKLSEIMNRQGGWSTVELIQLDVLEYLQLQQMVLHQWLTSVLHLVLGTCVALVTGVGLTLLLLSSVSGIGVGPAVDKDFLKTP